MRNQSNSPDLAIDPTADAIHDRKGFDIYRLTDARGMFGIDRVIDR